MLVGFGAAVPFMDTTLFEGPVSADWLHGGDIAFYVGFVVAGAIYWLLQLVADRGKRGIVVAATGEGGIKVASAAGGSGEESGAVPASSQRSQD